MGLLISKNTTTDSNLLIEKTTANENKPTRYFSKKQETAVAKAIGGRRTPNSGATAFSKGDVVTPDQLFLIECKTKTSHSDSISIKKSWIDKNVQEKVFMGKDYSALAFSFGPNEPNYYIVDEQLFLELVEYLRIKKEQGEE